MIFSKLSQYFQKLEATSSRNLMVEILAQLFKEAAVEEIDKVVYLTQGRVAPLYEPVEFQMAEQTVLKALGQTYKTSVEKVTADYKKTGDLGVVAQDLSKNQESGIKNYAKTTVEEVFNKLLEIARMEGVGSVEKKISLLADLLKNSDPLSARYLVRILLDKLRLGFSDMTVLEGLSWMIDGTKKYKDRIEAAYNVRPDLGLVAGAIRRIGNIGGIGNIDPEVGTPVLPMRAERLTSAGEILEKTGGQCAAEPKLDGIRIQLHYRRVARGAWRTAEKKTTSYEPQATSSFFVRLFSRGLEDITAMYPDLVEAAEEELKGINEIILDGEAIGMDPKTGKYLPFQETVQRKRKYDIGLFARDVPVRLVVFDVLLADGESFLNQPYEYRRKYLEGRIKGKTIVLAEMTVVSKPEELERIFAESVAKGLEGIMAKKLDGVYQAGARGWSWIKYKKSYAEKLADTVDAVVMGLDFGQGRRNKFGVGAFLIGIYDHKTDTYKTVSKIGTGLTDEEWHELKVKSQKSKVKSKPKNYDVNKLMGCDVWLAPAMVGEFRADALTRSPMHTAGYALRFPRLEKWREKKPEDTTGLRELERMAAMQSR